MKRTAGYTLIELAVVIAVLGVLTLISAVAFNLVQVQSRDSKREADIKIISVLLEAYYDKNGEYPTDSALYSWTQPGQSLEPYVSSSGSVIGLSTTLASLRSVLGPNIADSFGDPTRSNPDYLFNNVTLSHTGFQHRYVYIGGVIGKSSVTYGSPITFTSRSGTFRCDYTVTTTASRPTSYVLGYYEEATDKWNFYYGAKGDKIRIYDTYDTTCFNHITIKNL